MLAAREVNPVLDPKSLPLSAQPGHLPWASEAQRLSELLARPPVDARPTRRGDFALMDDLDSIWADEERLTSW